MPPQGIIRSPIADWLEDLGFVRDRYVGFHTGDFCCSCGALGRGYSPVGRDAEAIWSNLYQVGVKMSLPVVAAPQDLSLAWCWPCIATLNSIKLGSKRDWGRSSICRWCGNLGPCWRQPYWPDRVGSAMSAGDSGTMRVTEQIDAPWIAWVANPYSLLSSTPLYGLYFL